MKKLTITVDDDVYAGLHSIVGRRRVGRFLSDLARPHVIKHDLDEAYREMAADEEREREAMEWAEGLIADVADEPRSLAATRRGMVDCLRPVDRR